MKRWMACSLLSMGALAGCAHGGTAPPPSPEPSPAAEGSVLERESQLTPEQIRLVQRSLVDRGFAVGLTGVLDPSTRVALTEFQRARGLRRTGTLDARTTEALGLDPRDVVPVRGREAGGDDEGAEHHPAEGNSHSR